MSDARICILDYGMGNLRSVEKALEHVGATATIANDAATVEAADGLILPGVGAFPKAMTGIRELGLDELIAERREVGVPILGICLGAQLVATALGACVTPNQGKEIGWHEVSVTEHAATDPLFAGFAERETVFHWHSDTFALPRGAVHLAKSELCDNQAFRYGTNVYGLQFHLEADAPLIERWLRVPVHRRELESTHGAIAPDRIREQIPAYLPRSTSLGERTFAELIKLFGVVNRHVVLRSR